MFLKVEVQVTILGAGAFGTALSIALCKTGKRVCVWGRNKQVVDSLRTRGENPVYLPGFKVPKEVSVYSDMGLAAEGAAAALICVPAQELRSLCNAVMKADALAEGTPLLVCSKGIENSSLKFPSEVVAEILPRHPVFVLSGPALARELASGLPCAMVLAGDDIAAAETLALQLSGPSLAVVHSGDLMGVQAGAVMKNIIAIASGIIAGMGLGHNASAIVMVQGMSEIKAVCEAKVGMATTETLTGLSCLGDLVLTCTTPGSRNMSFGISVGKAGHVGTPGQQKPMLVEGVESVMAMVNMGKALNLELPICSAIARMLHGQLGVRQAAAEILSAPVKSRISV
ncbi:NAD(P)H-dependent glycerol-3-phosphate dehydrogenase [Anaplasma centrale str. Israel]|uniref:Glycerol-3-phosphate dehydrogenase [NAD(P)+] n=1 Tax=Anaplasma centrale (strain Israel) TaxID=574556 RepID=D1ATX3_ANACI|nr:NAD(P)H-dependent glycerol-3-phosphate dehydrogenase [Anaplasma centrale]ACZ49001.1 NAD(P)H-dependent glycerol-3-phosphate dehydrogenase [Anaplasma centrale str. Israel]